MHKRIALITTASMALLGIVAIAPAPPVGAVDPARYVAPGGSDTANDCQAKLAPCATVGHALAQASAYDTVQLEPGTYLVNDNAPGEPNATHTFHTTITSDPVGGSATNTIIDATGEPYGLVASHSGTTIQNLTVRNADREGILVGGVGNSVVDAFVEGNLVIDNDQCVKHPGASDCSDFTPGARYGAGITLYGVRDSQVRSNKLYRNYVGILVTDSGTGDSVGGDIVAQNSTNSNVASGIEVASITPGVSVTNITVNTNVSNENGGAGFLFTESVAGAIVQDDAIVGNYAAANALPGITLHTPLGGGAFINGNSLRDDALRGGANGGAGDAYAGDTHTTGILVIAPLGHTPNTITSNAIADVFYGIWISSGTHATLSGNEFAVDAGGTNVFLDGSGHAPVTGIATNSAGSGYWLTTSAGDVFGYGFAHSYGSLTGVALARPIVGITSTPSGQGYWLVASDGGIFAFGDAHFYGSTGAIRLNQPIVGMAATVTGHGYRLVASDGGIFAFGDAHFYGSTGGMHLNQPIVGMAVNPFMNGYWLVASDGGIFRFGFVRFYGSMGARHLNQPIVGMATGWSGNGYWLVARDGGIFGFGHATFYGSTGGIHLNQPIVGMASTPGALGYWLVASDGGIFTYGNAPYLGSLAAR